MNWVMKVRPTFGADGKRNGVTWDVFHNGELVLEGVHYDVAKQHIRNNKGKFETEKEENRC